MSAMKSIALDLEEHQARFVVIVPFGPRRFFRSRLAALAYVTLQRAGGRVAFVFPGL
jgi:hypothetical protein